MSQKDQADIAGFSIFHEDTGKGLVNYLQMFAAADEARWDNAEGMRDIFLPLCI